MAELKESLNEPKSITALEVKDICTTIEEAMHPHIGFAIDSSDILRGLYQVETQKCALAQSHTTLDEFLPSIKRHDYVLADYYCLAVTLASSVLQLSETPWLHQPWSRRSIAFLRLKGGNASSVDIRHPYLTCQYCAGKRPHVVYSHHLIYRSNIQIYKTSHRPSSSLASHPPGESTCSPSP